MMPTSIKCGSEMAGTALELPVLLLHGEAWVIIVIIGRFILKMVLIMIKMKMMRRRRII